MLNESYAAAPSRRRLRQSLLVNIYIIRETRRTTYCRECVSCLSAFAVLAVKWNKEDGTELDHRKNKLETVLEVLLE